MTEDELLRSIAAALAHSLPPAWQECVVVYRALGSYSEIEGRFTRPVGPPHPFTAPYPVAEFFERLRTARYRPESGTWFTATFRLDYPADHGIDYDDGEPAFAVPPPDTARLEERRRFPRDPAPVWLTAPDFRALPVARPFRSADGPVLHEPEIPETERATMLDYLVNAPVVLAARGHDTDLLDPERARNVPITYHTDGTWVWPGAVPHYLRVHGAPPQPELADHIRRAGFQLPEIPEPLLSAALKTVTTPT